MSTKVRTGRLPQKKSNFVWKHHALTQDLVIARKKGLELLINLYCYWTHDADKYDISIKAWFDAWEESMESKGIVKDDGEPYSLSYLRIYTNKVKQAVDGGYNYRDIKSVKKLEEMVDNINGKTDKKETSELDKVLARIDKMDARSQRAVYNRLAKKFG